MACSNISTRLAVVMAMAPPDIPSPVMIATLGTPKRQAGVGRARDGFGLSAFLGADAGIGAGGIDDRQHGNAESIRHLHQPDRLAIALRPRHAEIMLDAGVG